MSTNKYELSSIQAFHGNVLGVSVDELKFTAGRLHILTGSNGSGKSTLLSVLAFLMKPDRGQVIFDDVPVKWELKECALLRKRVTLLHQNPYLFSGTVAANVAFGPLARRASKDVVRSVVEESLEMVGLRGFESRAARQLSGGESRRVALARALACRPEVLLLDEPLAHVDKATAAILELLVVSLSAKGMTIVMSSHDERLGERLGGRVIHLEDGKVKWMSEECASGLSHEAVGDHHANA